MAEATRMELERPEAIYANDYVRVHDDNRQFDGVVVGIEPGLDQALVHEYSATGLPTSRLHEVDTDALTQHETGRTL